MEFKFVLGVDMSKSWFNYCLMSPELEIIEEGRVENTPQVIIEFINRLLDLLGLEQITDVLLCIEHTGIYVKLLSSTWLAQGGRLSLIHAPKISQHLSGRAGWEQKEDSLDARRIGEYAFRFKDKLKLWVAKPASLTKLQHYQKQRERLISVINQLEVPLKEIKQFESQEVYQGVLVHQEDSVKALRRNLDQLEKTINEHIKLDPHLAPLFKLICSVDGIGPVTAREIIIATSAFSDFLPNQAKAFARYTGVTPNKYRSGQSIRKKDKIGKRAHKKLKSLLTMGAHSLIDSKSELSQYYHRKKAEGKHHLSIINAMRNKLILRVFAVVRNQVMYQKNLNLHLD